MLRTPKLINPWTPLWWIREDFCSLFGFKLYSLLGTHWKFMELHQGPQLGSQLTPQNSIIFIVIRIIIEQSCMQCIALCCRCAKSMLAVAPAVIYLVGSK